MHATRLTLGLLCIWISVAYSAVAHQQRGIQISYKARETADAPVAGTVNLYPKSYALVIGNDLYNNGWSRLSNGVKDAREIAKALEGVGFDVTLKTNLKRRDFARSIEDWIFEYGGDKNARLFIWYAGHGHTDSKGEGYLVPVDAPSPSQGEFQFKRFGLNMRNFGTWVRTAQTNHVYAVFDSCFAGTVFNSARAAPPPAITLATTKPVRQFLTSGDADQTVSDDGTFRRLFIEALKGERRADANADGYLTASELGMFMGDQITNLTEGAQTPRHGKLRDPDYNQGDFVFAQLSAPALPSARPAPRQLPAAPAVALSTASAEIVLEAQQRLNKLGYRVAESGNLDTRTSATIRQFEADRGLIQTGAIDAILIEQLKDEWQKRDDEAWDKAKSARTISAVVAYGKNWPDGRHVANIEGAAWASAERQNSKSAYNAYIKAFPAGPKVAVARSKLASLETVARDDSAWRNAKNQRTIAALDGYAENWPEGRHISAIPRQKNLVNKARQLSPLALQWEAGFGKELINGIEDFATLEDGGFLIFGNKYEAGPGFRSILVRLDAAGNELWTKLYDASKSRMVRSMVRTSDGGFVFGGYAYQGGNKERHAWVSKVDIDGNKLWDKAYSGEQQGQLTQLLALPNGGVLMVGYQHAGAQKMYDGWLQALDRDGNELWQKLIGYRNWDRFFAATRTADNGLLLVGDTWHRGRGQSDAWIVKLDKNNNKLWEKTYGGAGIDNLKSLSESADGSVFMLGTTASKGAGGTDIWLMRVHRNGNKIWDKTFGDKLEDGMRDIKAIANGAAIMSVSIQRDKKYAGVNWLMGIDRDGNSLWRRHSYGQMRDFHKIQVQPNSNFTILGRQKKGSRGGIAKLGLPTTAAYTAMSKAMSN